MADIPRGGIYLSAYLAPFAETLARPDVTDIYVNRPGEIWTESITGNIRRHAMPDLTEDLLVRLATQIAAFSNQGISRAHPLLSATLPDGARVQIIMPPATRGPVAMAIRKHLSPDLALTDYVSHGAFDSVRTSADPTAHAGREALTMLLERGDVAGALTAAVRARRTILVSGGTSTGKTTFLNALMREIPAEERLLLIEDAPELLLRRENAVGLLASRSELGEAQVSADELVAASLRMRPDRIILGELRGPEAYAFLRAVNTGHPGSMTTVHADSPARAIEQIVLLVLQGGSRLNREDVRHYVQSCIGVYVQLGRSGGRRQVTDVVIAR